MDPYQQFVQERLERSRQYARDAEFQATSSRWIAQAMERMYVYNFEWLGRPVIQQPVDLVAFQELVWTVRPDRIVETGVAHGGSLIFSASLLALVDMCEALETGGEFDVRRPKRKVLGIEIDLRAHNRAKLEAHPLWNRIEVVEGSSVDPAVVAHAAKFVAGTERVLVALDSNHTHEHVLGELNAYSPFVTPGSYLLACDSIVEDMPPGSFPNRPWDVGNNPKTAVHAFLKTHPEFAIDHDFQSKLMVTTNPDGYLRRVG